MEGPDTPQSEAIRNSLHDLLKERQFSHLAGQQDSPSSNSQLESFLKAVSEDPLFRKAALFADNLFKPLKALLHHILERLMQGDLLWYGLMIACALILIIIVFQIYFIIDRNLVAHREKKVSRPGERIRAAREHPPACRAQDHCMTVRELYGAMLIILRERGFIESQSSATNGEVEAEIRKSIKNEAYEAFCACSDIFDASVYGESPLSEQVYSDFIRHYECFRRIV